MRTELVDTVSSIRQTRRRLQEKINKLKRAQEKEELTAEGIMRDARVLVTVISARELIPWGIDGTSNPYAMVTVGGHSETTEVVQRTLEPQWQQSF